MDNSDAPPDIYKAWYEIAKGFAKGEINEGDAARCTKEAMFLLLGMGMQSGRMLARGDEYVVKSMLGK